MKRYYPLLRREAIRLAAPIGILVIAVISYLGNFGSDISAEIKTFEAHGMSYFITHPSNFLFEYYILFALLLGMILGIVQHIPERSAQNALYWEMLPYSRWEKMLVKTMCAMVPVALLCMIGYRGVHGIVSLHADGIAKLNSVMSSEGRLDNLLRADRLMVHWISLFVGAFTGYALTCVLCQIFAHWWRAAVVGIGIFCLLAEFNIYSVGGILHWQTVIDGRETWLTARDAMNAVPVVAVSLLAAAGMMFAAFILERKRPFERTGMALYWPQMQGYVCAAIVVLSMIGTARWSNISPVVYIPCVAALTLILPFDVPKFLRFRK